MRLFGKIAAIGTVLVTVAAVGAGVAAADPPPGVFPATTDIVGLNAPVTDPVVGALANAYTVTSPPRKAYTWSPFGWPTIQTKGNAGGNPPLTSTDPACYGSRPAATTGNSRAIQLLADGYLTHDGNPCVDFVSLDRQTDAADPTGLIFTPFAEDAVTWAALAPSAGGHVPSGATFTVTQLAEIYSCSDPNHGGAPWRWADFFPGSGDTDSIVPVLPEPASSVRAAFLADIGVSTPGACVINGSYNNTPIEENDGTNAVFSLSGSPYAADAIVPYSIGAFISQEDTMAVTDQHPGSLVLQDLTSVVNGFDVTVAPIIGDGATAMINYNLPPNVDRLLYNVTRNAGSATTPRIPPYLVPLFGNRYQGGWICDSTAAANIIRQYGFLVLSAANCGRLILSQ